MILKLYLVRLTAFLLILNTLKMSRYIVDCIFTLLCFIVPVIFVHASLRLRNIKNKIVNRVEVLGLKRTPMGFFLEQMGLEGDFF